MKIERPGRLTTDIQGNVQIQCWEEQENPVEQNLRFQGQYYDQETGLHYNRFRYYDPDCGRFVSRDPIGLRRGIDNCQYAPNPLGWVDPFGLKKSKGSKRLRDALGALSDDCHQAHHLIPEEVMDDKVFAKLFQRLSELGFDRDGAGSGIVLPGNEELARATGLPGH